MQLNGHLIFFTSKKSKICNFRPQGKAPHFITKPTIKQERNQLVLAAALEGAPEPKLRWFREDKEIAAGPRYVMSCNKNAGGPDRFDVSLIIKVGTILWIIILLSCSLCWSEEDSSFFSYCHGRLDFLLDCKAIPAYGLLMSVCCLSTFV